MDVVYLVKPSNDNEELRYSLRSLQNLPHDQVWFAGHKPRWATGVNHIPVTQYPSAKHQNSVRNQRAAYEHPEISDPFLLLNDDHFVMKPQDRMPVLNWGFVDDVLEDEPRLGASFRASMQYTRELLTALGFENPLSYQLHVPLIIHKEQMLRVMEEFPNEAPGINIQYVTLAGNLYGWGGKSLPHDVKLLDRFEPVPQWARESDFLSTSDGAFNYGTGGQYIRASFPARGPYEKRRA